MRISDARTGNLLGRLRGHWNRVYSVAFTPDANGLISGSMDKTMKYWDLTGLGAPNVRSSSPASFEMGCMSDSEEAVSAEDNVSCTMNFAGHKARPPLNCYLSIISAPSFQDYISSVAVSHDGQWVLSGSPDRTVQIWDAKSATVQLMLQGHKDSGT